MDTTLKNILLIPMNILYKFSPRNAIKLLFLLKQGYRLDLSNPVTFTEKLNWMKIYYRDDLIPLCADKYTVRQYIKDCGYEELLNDLLWEGFDAKEIPFDKLPDQFVIKVTHGCGLLIICKNKKELNTTQTIKKLNKWLKQKYIPCYGEWFYGKVKPRIIIEKFLSEDGDTLPTDYKLYYFNNMDGIGDVGCTAVHTDRFRHHTMTMYDADWNMMPEVSFGYLVNKKQPKLKHYSEMVEITKKLAKPFLHARIDFYIIGNRLYVGEITFMCSAGFANIRPREFNVKMGNWIQLPGKVNVRS